MAANGTEFVTLEQLKLFDNATKCSPDNVTIQQSEDGVYSVKKGGITGDNIADGSITADKLAQDVISQIGVSNPITSISYGNYLAGTGSVVIYGYPASYDGDLYFLRSDSDESIFKITQDGVVSTFYSTSAGSGGDAKIIWKESTLYLFSYTNTNCMKLTPEGVATPLNYMPTWIHLSKNGCRNTATFIGDTCYLSGRETGSSNKTVAYNIISNTATISSSGDGYVYDDEFLFSHLDKLYKLRLKFDELRVYKYSSDLSVVEQIIYLDERDNNAYISSTSVGNYYKEVLIYCTDDAIYLVGNDGGYGKVSITIDESSSIALDSTKTSFYISDDFSTTGAITSPATSYTGFFNGSKIYGIKPPYKRGVFTEYIDIEKSSSSSKCVQLSSNWSGTTTPRSILYPFGNTASNTKFLTGPAVFNDNYSGGDQFIITIEKD